MTVLVRRAIPADIDTLCALGKGEPAFSVSEKIRFYERKELEEWIADPEGNLLLVLDDEDVITGFLFCKIMSYHWAYLDNFYVRPGYRRHGQGMSLMQALLDLLREKKIVYLSTLVEEKDTFLAQYLGMSGFVSEKTYVWLERFAGKE